MKNNYIKYLSVLENSDINEIATKLEKGYKGINGILAVLDNKFRIVGSISDGDFRRFLKNNSSMIEKASSKNIMNDKPIFFEKTFPLEQILLQIPNRLEAYNRNPNVKLRYIFFTDSNNCFLDVLDISEYHEEQEHVAVFGLGYVGLTLSLVMANNNFIVTGIDNNEKIIDNLNKSISHVREPDLEKLLSKNLNKNLFLQKTLNKSFNTYIISVGTPISNIEDKISINKNYLISVLDSISEVLSQGNLIILRSTVPIGTCRKVVIPLLESKTGMICGLDFFVSFAPERTEEGNALKELTFLPQIIGGFDNISTKKTKAIFERITNNIVVLESLEEAEMVKLINNSFRDYVFGFSNQIARIANKYNLDINNVIKSANYKYPRNPIPFPSPGVGGPCLTKDPYIFNDSFFDDKNSLFIESRKENELMPNYVCDLTESRLKTLGKQIKSCKIFCCGLAFKGNPKTGDIRNSSGIEILKLLTLRSDNVYGFDFEADKTEILKSGIKFLDLEEGFKDSDVVLLLNNHSDFKVININKLSENSNKDLLIIDCWNLLDYKVLNNRITYSNLSKIYLK